MEHRGWPGGMPTRKLLSYAKGHVGHSCSQTRDMHTFSISSTNSMIQGGVALSESQTPWVDEYFRTLDNETARAFADLDAIELEQQRARVAPWVATKLKTPSNSVERRLRNWEMLCFRIDGARGRGAYMIDEYVNDLDIRDSLELIRGRLSGVSSKSFDALLKKIDDRFIALTIDDAGEELRWRISSSAIGDTRAWWWYRRPREIPWSDSAEPSGGYTAGSEE